MRSTRSPPYIALLAALLVFGCKGTLDENGASPDGGLQQRSDAGNNNGSVEDMGGPSDMGSNNGGANNGGSDGGATTDGGDTGSPDLGCTNVTCGDNASCSGGVCSCDPGYMGDPDSGCVSGDPCADVDCPFGATCSAGNCECDYGFSDDGANGCTLDPVSDPAGRTRQEVCDRWMNDYATNSPALFEIEPVDQCDIGVLHPETIKDALRRTSLYRWLVGLPAVTSQDNYLEVTQHCATTLAAEDAGLTHDIPQGYACYTQQAASGAGSSNLAVGVSRPAGSVDLYVGDFGVTSLGHRRWVINPGMGATGFGQRGSYSCMYSFDRNGAANPDYVAYPSAGFFPNNALLGPWSWGSNTYGFDSNTTVEITDDQGAAVEVQNVYIPGGGYGLRVIAWSVPNAQVDVEYTVTLDGLSGPANSVSYTTTLVNCP